MRTAQAYDGQKEKRAKNRLKHDTILLSAVNRMQGTLVDTYLMYSVSYIPLGTPLL